MSFDRRDINLVTAAGSEKLPLVLVKSWAQWHVDATGLCEVETTSSAGDWLDPRHTQELWLAEGLDLPQAEIGIQFMIKGGELRCIMPSLVSTLIIDDQIYRNRGLRTLPLAHTWTNFAGLQLGRLRLHSFVRTTSKASWEQWIEPVALDAALSAIIPIIADGPEALSQGFHLVSTSITTVPQTLRPDHEYGLVLGDGDHLDTLLDLEEAPCACLKVTSCSTAPMSKSYSSPEVYQALIRSETKS